MIMVTGEELSESESFAANIRGEGCFMIEAKISYLIFDTETTGLPKNWNAPVLVLNVF